ncbi:MAG: class I SAM-dependent methyltransferase [Bacteroidales bacterium]
MAGIVSMVKSGFTTDGYYRSMNEALRRLNEEYTMLHYPYYVNEDDGFYTAQKNLTDYCIKQLPAVEGRSVLEIGCGNGVQSIYILQKFAPSYVKGVDLNDANIEIANGEAERLGLKEIEFEVGDAQNLSEIPDGSFDFVVNIESAFHYPDKPAFLSEVRRVLKPGGYFLIADILKRPRKSQPLRRSWKKNMHLNHWTEEAYNESLIGAGLHVEKFEDITDNVINGFRRYPYWLKTMRKKNIFSDTLLKTFYSVNVVLNIRLLHKRRQYVVISGKQGPL